MAAKEKDDNAPIPIRRTREETASHVFAEKAAVDPNLVKVFIEAAQDLVDWDDEGNPKKKKKKAKVEGGEPPRKALWATVIGLLASIMLSQAAQWYTDIKDLSESIEKVLVFQEKNLEQVEDLDKKVDLISEDYEVMERALVDYIQIHGPGTPLPDSVIILRDKHNRTR